MYIISDLVLISSSSGPASRSNEVGKVIESDIASVSAVLIEFGRLHIICCKVDGVYYKE